MKFNGNMIKKLILAVLIFSLAAIPALTSQKGKTTSVTSTRDLMDAMEISKVAGEVKAPDFMLKNLMGEPIRLSDYQGKIVLLNFWTTW